MRGLRLPVVVLAMSACGLVVVPGPAKAQEQPAPAPSTPASAPPPAEHTESVVVAPADVDLERDTKTSSALADVPAAPLEAPPPEPYKKSLVLDTSLGALFFTGDFAAVAPPAPWLHTQLGYEIFKWLMLFGEGELAFTTTGNAQDPPKTRAFPLFGFGGGARFTWRVTDRIGLYLQGSLGAMKADIRQGALRLIGHQAAEDLGLYAGGRLGFEWYQIDRHLALGVTVGPRLATGLKKSGPGASTPLVLDTGISLRYAF